MSVTPFQPITKEQAAEILGVSIRSVENYVSEGEMPAPAHLGRRVYWHPDVFYGWLDAHLRSAVPDDSDNRKSEGVPVSTSGQVIESPSAPTRKKSTAQDSGTAGKKAMNRATARSSALLKQLSGI